MKTSLNIYTQQNEKNVSNNCLNNLINNKIIELMHDLKTPMISIIGFLQLLESNNQELKKILNYKEVEENIGYNLVDSSSGDFFFKQINQIISENEEFISESLMNTDQFLSQISNFAMMSKQKQIELINLNEIPMVNKLINIKNTVEKISRLLKSKIIQNKINIYINIPDNQFILINEGVFEKIMTHLLENAIKYNCYGGFIEISSENNENNEIVIDIIDTGIGFSREQLRKANLPYFNIISKENELIKNKYSYGAGLTIVRKLMNDNGGKMIINSMENQGTTVKLFFPNRSLEKQNK